MTDNNWLTKQEAADFLQVHPKTLMRWVKVGGLKAYRIGRLVRFNKADLEAYLERQTIVTNEEE